VTLKPSDEVQVLLVADVFILGDDLIRERASVALEVVVERLVQRLLCGAAMIDSRFSCKFLATLDGVRTRRKVRSLHTHIDTSKVATDNGVSARGIICNRQKTMQKMLRKKE
jgi:hypothetical protein